MSSAKKSVFIFTLIIAGVAGFWASKSYYNQEQALNFKSLLLFPDEKSFSGFTLIDKNQNKITNESFNNKWTLLFFGYTNCPDVCPTTLSELQKAFKIINQNSLKQIPNVLFVSVDSERDTPASLKEYIGFFNSKFNAATADKANILSLASQIGVAYRIDDHKKGELNYEVDHTAAIFLVNPNAKLFGIFRSPHDARNIASDLISLIGTN